MVDQHNVLRVKLADILEGLDFQSDERSSYLNTTTGEVVSITDEELRAAENAEPLENFPEWQHDAIRIAGEIIETEHYLPLPDRFEINEYRIMERFCLSVDAEDMRDDLCDAIRGRGAFRRFKDRLQAYGMAEDWYQYRDAALREIAVAWCARHMGLLTRHKGTALWVSLDSTAAMMGKRLWSCRGHSRCPRRLPATKDTSDEPRRQDRHS